MHINEICEKQAVKLYLTSKGLIYNDSNLVIRNQNDSVDVYVDIYKMQFQVTSVDGGPQKLNKYKKYNWRTQSDEAIKLFITDPVLKKNKLYRGKSVNNVILLIHAISCPLINWLRPSTEEESIGIFDLLKNSGFKEIQIVDDMSNNVIELYPNFTIN